MAEAAPGTYQSLQQQSNISNDADILRDLSRTYPNNLFFMDRQGPGQHALYNLLR
jgi:hypothetical protein